MLFRSLFSDILRTPREDLFYSGGGGTVRGQQGGIRLARAPGEIGLGDVVRRTEGQIGLVPCMDADQPGYCAITSACKLRRALQQASNAFFAVLDDYTLADLTENDAALRGLLPRHAPKADASLG